MKNIFISLLILSSSKALTHEQLKVRSLVMKIAKERYPKYRTVIKGMSKRESSYGLFNFGDDRKSMFALQVSAIAFKDVAINVKEFQKYSRYTKKRLNSILLANGQEFAIIIGVEYLKLLVKRWGSISLALDHYNGDSTGGYRRLVLKEMKEF